MNEEKLKELGFKLVEEYVHGDNDGLLRKFLGKRIYK